MGNPVDLNGASDDGWIATKPALPESVSEHDSPVPPNHLLLGNERATHRRGNADRGEEVAGDTKALHQFRLVATDEVRIPPLERREPLDGGTVCLELEEVGRRHGPLPIEVALTRVREQHDAIHVWQGEGTKHDRIDHREDGGIGAKGEPERQHDDHAEPGALRQGAPCMANVGEHCVHPGPLQRSSASRSETIITALRTTCLEVQAGSATGPIRVPFDTGK